MAAHMDSQNARRTGRRSAIDRVHDVSAHLAGAVLILITLIVLAGVASRAVFGQPVPASNELIGSCLMVALVYLSLSAATHIRITVVTRRLPPAWTVWTERAVLVFSAAGLAFAAWAALSMAVTSFRTGESTVGLYTFDIAPFRLLIFAGVVLLLLRLVREGRSWLAEETQETHEAHEPAQEPQPAQGPQTAADSAKDD
ncbi:TRAP transporter small permease [Streptomyces armeniacus]|uniref:TRAP transporter small permease n=1 Tax=Streptomyces armeniacus TaxID=83291 RepID=A0A345XPV7_9ACTN|nr:TRAP transporter small permease [Streptomyces armeniacus]AXK33673.1 TRAP transporter small permease [Streptomyces armeniacus]